MNRQLSFLDAFSFYLRALSIVSVIAGFITVGLIIYGWGQFTAFYNMLRAALDTIMSLDPEVSSALQLPAIPIWPLILLILLLLLLIATLSLTLWAFGASIDLRLKLAEEEREARRMQKSTLHNMQQSLESIARYFAALLPPRK